MGILEGFKRTLNIAGSKIIVVTESKIYSQLDLIRGEVVVTAPQYKQVGNSINLELKEFWTETMLTGRSSHRVTMYKTHAKITLQGAFDFEPGSQHRFPFEVGLPRNCRISTESSGWCLMITLKIPYAKNPSEFVVLKVQPAKEFLAIIEVCEEFLRFQERQKSRQWNTRSFKTYFRLMPPEVLKSELDYMAFEIFQAEDGNVEGDLIFNLQEKSIADYFKAAIGKDRIKRQFHLASSQLYSQDGRVCSGYVVEVIRVLLKEGIDHREH